MLVLAGPRRHYLIRQCRDRAIPDVYVGDETYIDAMKDDFSARANIVDEAKMALLYNLADTYLVVSRSEGGPNAVLESSLCKTPIVSTRVGMAPDLLATWCLFDSVGEVVDKITNLMHDSEQKTRIGAANYQNVIAVNNWRAFRNRVADVLRAWGYADKP